jgi:hypothetical protein
MAAGRYDFAIERGAYFERTITVLDDGVARPLAGYAIRMQLRASFDATAVLLELTTENARIGLSNPGAGQFMLSLDVTTTTGLTFVFGVYDLELVPPDGKVERLLYGQVRVSPEVTR